MIFIRRLIWLLQEVWKAQFLTRDFSAAEKAKLKLRLKTCGMQFPDKDGGEPVTALQNVNLEIRQGEFVSLVGPSGCGKTTLLRTIADLQQPTSGNITVRGQTPREIRLQKKYGIVFQSPVLYDWRTVRRNVCMPMELMGLPKKYRTATRDGNAGARRTFRFRQEVSA